MSKSKRIAAAMLSAIMAFGSVPAALATEVDAGGVGKVPVALSQEATTFSVSIPTTLPIAVTADHVIGTAKDAQLVNNSYGPIQVKQVQVNEQNGWSLVSHSTDFRKVKVNAKQFGMELQGIAVDPSGVADASAFLSINGKKSLGLTYDAVVAAQSATISATVANIVFTIGWDTGDVISAPVQNLTLTSANLADVGIDASGTNLVIPSTVTDGEGTTYSVKSIANSTFEGNDTIQTATISEGVASLGSRSFANCASLMSVSLPSTTESVASDAFDGDDALTAISVDKETGSLTGEPWGAQNAEVTYTGSEASTYALTSVDGANLSWQEAIDGGYVSVTDGVLTGGDKRAQIKTMSIDSSVTSIGEGAFMEASELTSVTIPESVTSIAMGSFAACGNLDEIKVASGNTKYDSRANCSAIIETASNTLIQGSNTTVIPSDVTSIGDLAFWGCSNLTSVSIPDGVGSIGSSAFYNCSSLSNVNIPSGVTQISYGCFSGCTSLTEIEIPLGVTTIDGQAFTNTRLTSVQIPDSVTYIGTCAFSIPTLTSIVIPNSVETIENGAFSCCSITSIEIPEGISSIKANTFEECTNLCTVTIPASVTKIEENAFLYCEQLSDINYNGTQEQWNNIIKGTGWNETTGSYTIHCTDGNLAKS